MTAGEPVVLCLGDRVTEAPEKQKGSLPPGWNAPTWSGFAPCGHPQYWDVERRAMVAQCDLPEVRPAKRRARKPRRMDCHG
jgi:hypothetical protein